MSLLESSITWRTINAFTSNFQWQLAENWSNVIMKRLRTEQLRFVSVSKVGGSGREKLKRQLSLSPTVLWIVNVCEKKPTISFTKFWDFLMFYQIFLSPQVTRCAIITCKHGIYELPHEFSNGLRLRCLKNVA